jgi:hypothetical protein
VGDVVRMPRGEVVDNPNAHCSHGLHVGTFNFAKGYGGTMLLCKIDPENVVSVPNDSSGRKIRVCVLEVLEIINERVSSGLFRAPENEPVVDESPDQPEECGDECDGCLDCTDTAVVPDVATPENTPQDDPANMRKPSWTEWQAMIGRAKLQRKSVKAVACTRKHGWILVGNEANDRESYRIT